MTARSAAERARAWRERQHTEALDHVLGLLATLPEVAIADALGRLTTGQLQLIGHHLITVAIRQGDIEPVLEPDQVSGSVRAGANDTTTSPVRSTTRPQKAHRGPEAVQEAAR
jgi:hypothetical protein